MLEPLGGAGVRVTRRAVQLFRVNEIQNPLATLFEQVDHAIGEPKPLTDIVELDLVHALAGLGDFQQGLRGVLQIARRHAEQTKFLVVPGGALKL